MPSFFKLADAIEAATYAEDQNLYEEDSAYYQSLKEKSFDELVQIAKARTQRLFWQSYGTALRELLTFKTDFDPNEQDPENGCTVLNHIVLTGELSLVKALVEAGADVNVRRKDGGFALLYAAKHGLQDIFDYLWPLTSTEFRDQAAQALPLGLQTREREENVIVEAFTTAALCGNERAIAQALTGQFAQALARNTDTDTNNNSANANSANANSDTLPASGNININAIDSAGESALHKAIREHHLPVVKQLLAAGADIELQEEKYGCPPLMFAIRRSNEDIIQLLLRSGAAVNRVNYAGFTALMYAVIFQPKVSLISQLLISGAYTQAQNDTGKTAHDFARQLAHNATQPSFMGRGNNTDNIDEIMFLLREQAAVSSTPIETCLHSINREFYQS